MPHAWIPGARGGAASRGLPAEAPPTARGGGHFRGPSPVVRESRGGGLHLLLRCQDREDLGDCRETERRGSFVIGDSVFFRERRVECLQALQELFGVTRVYAVILFSSHV